MLKNVDKKRTTRLGLLSSHCNSRKFLVFLISDAIYFVIFIRLLIILSKWLIKKIWSQNITIEELTNIFYRINDIVLLKSSSLCCCLTATFNCN